MKTKLPHYKVPFRECYTDSVFGKWGWIHWTLYCHVWLKLFPKRSVQILSTICAAMLFQGGCATTDVQSYATPANARISAAILCTGTLTVAVKQDDRPMVAAYIYAVAQGVRSLAGGTVPSPDQLRSTVALFTHNADVGQWTVLATSIQGIYTGLYAQLKGNPKLAADYLEAIAAGCEDAAAPFLVHTTPIPASPLPPETAAATTHKARE